MMETKLISVQRSHGRATLVLSTGETLVMPRAMLKERPYRGGTPFDREAFDSFLRERSYPFAMEKAVALLAMRSRTQQEIADALRKNAYPERTIARVMARLDEAGYINDTDFAEQWAASRTTKGMGARRIRMELRQKGVDSEAIDEALSAIDHDDMLSGRFRQEPRRPQRQAENFCRACAARLRLCGGAASAGSVEGRTGISKSRKRPNVASCFFDMCGFIFRPLPSLLPAQRCCESTRLF